MESNNKEPLSPTSLADDPLYVDVPTARYPNESSLSFTNQEKTNVKSKQYRQWALYGIFIILLAAILYNLNGVRESRSMSVWEPPTDFMKGSGAAPIKK